MLRETRWPATIAVVALLVPGCFSQPSLANTAPTVSKERQVVFERNDGQTDARARFVARARGYRVFVTPDSLAIGLATPSGQHAVRLAFGGASTSATVHGERPLAGRVNYLRGSDPKAFVTGVPTFDGVRISGVYPGIDAVVYGRDGDVEYDFVVSPGADASAIRLELSGIDRPTIDANGDLVLSTPAGELRQRRPVAYETTGDVRTPVASRFRVSGDRIVTFEVTRRDPSSTLVIDPVLSYSAYVAGGGDESGAGITIDASGSAYLAGGSSSLDFPTTAGTISQTNAGSTDGFVAKLTPDGSGYAFSTYVGGIADEGIARAVVDAAGNIYICGGTASTDFPTTAGAFDTTFSGGSFDGFVAKLAPGAASIVYSSYLGGSGDDGAASIAIDSGGNAYVTGGSTSSNYPTTPGAFDTSNISLVGLPDAIVTKINPTGTALVYSTYLGAAFNLEAGAAIAVDSSGFAYVGGATNGGFPTKAGSFDTSFNGGSFDGFISKVNTTGTDLVYSTYLGGSDEDYVFSLAIDGSGNAYATGFTPSTNFPVLNAFQPAIGGGFDAYVTKLNTAGSALVYSSYLGGTGNEGLTSAGGTELQIAGGIAVDGSGNAYLTGFTDSTDFPVVAAWQPARAGGFDAFVVKVNAAGSAKVYASYLGGALEERGLGIAVDGAGDAYVTGFTVSTNFPTTAGAVRTVPGGNALSDGFVAKLGAGPGDTPGIYVPSSGAFFLRTSNSPGPAVTVFTFGPSAAGFVPLAGDWDGNGTTTIGIYDPVTGAFFLKNSDSNGAADIVFNFGAGGADIVPVVGDWNGDGTDTIGIYGTTTGAFFLRNTNDSGAADVVFNFGPGGVDFAPLSGDWNGDGVDTIGIYGTSSGVFFLRNANAPGGADLAFNFGPGGAGILPLAGDWNADGTDTIGIYASSTGAWFLRNANAGGGADLVFSYGPAGATPIAGHWGG